MHEDSQSLVYSRRSGRRADRRPAAYVIDLLEPHKRYTVCVKVISDTSASEAARDSVVTMIDRKYATAPERTAALLANCSGPV